MIKEFKEFISRGNVLDLAVGVIIGGAFGKIVTSLVNDIIMPLLGIILGGIDFTSLSFKVEESTVMYGMFIQNIIDFLLIAASIFLMIKIIGKLKKLEKKPKEQPKEQPKVPTTDELLTEIRDLLKKKTK